MNIPKKEGKYTLSVNGKTIDIVIRYLSQRMNKGEMIGMGIRSHIAHYKTVPEYSVKITNSNGDILDKLKTNDEYEYQEFISSFISKENGATVNPERISQELVWKFQKEAGAYVVNSKFNGIVKNCIKITFYFELRSIYDVEKAMEKVVPYFENLGIKCKIAPKKKRIRSWSCFVASLYLPLDYNLNEGKKYKRNTNMNKKLIRLTESDLHRIVKESVSRILNETNHIEIVEGSFGTITYLELFDYTNFPGRFPYVVKYSNEAYYDPIKDSYQLKSPIKSEGFKTYKECLNFSQENGIKIVDEFSIKHSLSKGILDTRAIKPWSHPKDFS